MDITLKAASPSQVHPHRTFPPAFRYSTTPLLRRRPVIPYHDIGLFSPGFSPVAFSPIALGVLQLALCLIQPMSHIFTPHFTPSEINRTLRPEEEESRLAMREKYEVDVAQWRRNVADRDKRIARLKEEIVTLPPEEEDSDSDDLQSWVEDSNEKAIEELECLERYGPPKHPILWDGPLPEFDSRINVLEMNKEFPPREYCTTLKRQV